MNLIKVNVGGEISLISRATANGKHLEKRCKKLQPWKDNVISLSHKIILLGLWIFLNPSASIHDRKENNQPDWRG